MPDDRTKAMPQEVAIAIAAGDFDEFLPRRVRDILLDLILAWARFDSAVAFLAASATGLNPDEGADKYGRAVIAEKLKAAAKALRAGGDNENAEIIDRLKGAFVPFAKLRNRVAHARCLGMRRSVTDQIVFMPYEREGPPGHLAIETYAIASFIQATEFADEAYKALMRGLNDAGFFDQTLAGDAAPFNAVNHSQRESAMDKPDRTTKTETPHTPPRYPGVKPSETNPAPKPDTKPAEKPKP